MPQPILPPREKSVVKPLPVEGGNEDDEGSAFEVLGRLVACWVDALFVEFIGIRVLL